MYRRMNDKKQKKKSFFPFRLLLCAAIICAAAYMKYTDAPIYRKASQVIFEKLKIDQAVEAVSRAADIGEEIAEAFKADEIEEKVEQKSEPVFDTDYYTDDSFEELQKEIEEQREKAAEEEKQLSVETLSFQMGEEELHDDTKAEPFRIPPPSYCSYEKVSIGFKYKTPLYGVITSKFGYRDHPIINDASFHTGLDIAAKKGTAIGAFADGTVLEAGRNSTYGNYLLIEHTGGIRSFYGHNSKLSVKKGQKVKIGQKIAEVGSTGMSTGPHLHFEVRKGTTRLDPALYISNEVV